METKDLNRLKRFWELLNKRIWLCQEFTGEGTPIGEPKGYLKDVADTTYSIRSQLLELFPELEEEIKRERAVFWRIG
ncbi:MAG: hypothetical protein HY454_01700 [Parcubacteria group bacterium]|nr:hypothetical protein [Parcubacteria group bacterium]